MNRKRSRFSVETWRQEAEQLDGGSISHLKGRPLLWCRGVPRDMLEQVATIQLQHESLRRFHQRNCEELPTYIGLYSFGLFTRRTYEEPARVANARHARANPVGYNGSRLLADDATVAFDSACRARDRRDMTVPIGAPVIRAISL
jgi:hypothetical protein